MKAKFACRDTFFFNQNDSIVLHRLIKLYIFGYCITVDHSLTVS